MSKPLPLPPMHLREVVGPRDDTDFDNPSGLPIYPEWPVSIYRSVFDFGCGCGRIARKLLMQTPRPEKYVGMDPHRGVIDWASANLTTVAPEFRFLHHDVYSPGYAADNRLSLSDRFPLDDSSSTLVIAHSVFTHLSLDQAGFYLSEVARVLTPGGVAFTSWFFFDNTTTPFFPDGPHALYASEKDFAAAVIFDRRWFLKAIQRAGLKVLRTDRPGLPGHQWTVWLAKRTPDAVDQFPMGLELAGYLSGATQAARVEVPLPPDMELAGRTGSRTGTRPAEDHGPFQAPQLYGALTELDKTRQELVKWQRRAIGFRLLRGLARLLGLRRGV
jgi:SAM-dependent methyltransferase